MATDVARSKRNLRGVFPSNLCAERPTGVVMVLTVADGHVVVVLVCSSCKRSMLVRNPAGALRCGHCGERIAVPDTDETESAPPDVAAAG